MPLIVVAFAVAIVLSIILLATGQPVIPAHVWDAIWNMPPGMGALLGSLFGLLGVAGSALIGFQALVKNREREAEFARERDAELRAAEMATVASALRGELLAAQTYCEDRVRHWVKIRAVFGGPRKVGADQAIKMPLALVFDTPVYDSYVGRIGFLPSDVAWMVAEIYASIRPAPRVETEADVALSLVDFKLGAANGTAETVISLIKAVQPGLTVLADSATPPGPSAIDRAS